MFDMVIVLLNGSHSTESAIPFGIDQAERHGAPLALMRVIARPEPIVSRNYRHGGPAGHGDPVNDHELAIEEASVRASLASLLTRHGLAADTTLFVGIGDPFLRLQDRLRTYRRPLLVMVSGGRERTSAHDLDDAAHRLLEAGHVDILTVHAPVDRGSSRQWLTPPGTGELTLVDTA